MLKTTILPPPTVNDRPGRPAKYPFSTLAVGHSFVVPYGEAKFISMKQYCYQRSRAMARTFVCALLEDGSIQVYRKN